jgi:hypothetical protein
VLLEVSVLDILKLRVQSHKMAVAVPVAPVSVPGPGSRLHSSISKACCRNAEIMRCLIPDDGRKTVQEFCKGRGKEVLNKVSSSSSVLQCHFFRYQTSETGCQS